MLIRYAINTLAALTAVTVLLLVSGCVSVEAVNAYSGSARPDSEVATIFTPVPLLNPHGFVQKVDDVEYSMTRATVVKVIPGKHTISVFCVVDTRNAVVDLAGMFEAGHFYELHCRDTGGGTTRTTISSGSITTKAGIAKALVMDRGKYYKLQQSVK